MEFSPVVVPWLLLLDHTSILHSRKIANKKIRKIYATIANTCLSDAGIDINLVKS